jgi:multidrug resistance efflux pump
VTGTVIDVAAQPNVPIKQGETLFRIDPKPYEYIVEQKRAALAEGEQNVKELKTTVDQAEAAVHRSQAQLDLAQQTYGRQTQLLEKKVASQAVVDTASRNLEAARQTLAGVQAAQERAQLAYASNINGVNTTVARLEADLHAAEYDLAQTNVVAPTDGYVVQMLLRPGMTVSPATATMVFIHSNDVVLGAAFSQTAIPRLTVGNEAEVAFAAVPGRIFAGKVAVVAGAITQGQLQSTGTLIDPEDRSRTPGEILVRIDLADDIKTYNLPPGAVAQVAVYSDHWRPVAIIRRILLRMKGWLNYVI